MKLLPLDPGSSSLPDWLRDFKLAMLNGQIQAAKVAIFARLRAKAERPPGILERIQLNDAILLLRTRRERALHNSTLGGLDEGKGTGGRDDCSIETDSPKELDLTDTSGHELGGEA